MHLQVYDAPFLPLPAQLRGWGGLQGFPQPTLGRGLGQSWDNVFDRYWDDPVARHGWGGLWGLGQCPGATGMTSSSIASMAASGAATTGTILTTLAHMAIISSAFGPAAIVGAAVAGLTAVGIAIAKIFSGCGCTCVEATSIANQVAPYLQQNVDHYVNSPVRYKSMQTAALNNFDTAWSALVQACSNPALASAGARCISDRQRGSCAYKTSPGSGCPSDQSNCWTQDASGKCTFNRGGPNGSGNACWDWFSGFRDPISNDPCVQPDPTSADVASGATASQISSASTSTSGSNMLPILLIGGAVLLMMMSSS